MEKAEIVKVEETMLSTVSEPLFDIQIATAKRYPRNPLRVIENAIATVTRNETTAASCGYALPRGGKQIQGISVHLARIIAQFYGNIRVQVKAGEVGSAHVTASAIAFDLESNYAIQVDARRKILKRDGTRYDEDMINTTMLAAMAVAERNAILKVIPQSMSDEVYLASRQKLTGDLSDEQKLTAKRKEMMDFFLKRYDATEKDVLELLNKKTITAITPDDILTLRGVVQAIKDGETTIEEQFPRLKKKEDKKDNEKLFDNTNES